MIKLYILLLAGFAALIKGADLFVDGSSSLAGHLKVPKVIIGLTLVAMGTSAPELAVSVSAALKGANEIALSNVVGSNIFNLLCVLGVCSVIHPLPVHKEIIKRDLPVSIAATLFLMMVTCLHALPGIKGLMTSVDMIVGNVGRITGIFLLVFFALYMSNLIMKAGQGEEAQEEYMTVLKSIIFAVIGVLLIIGGGQAVVISAKAIAKSFGLSETFIGLTIVAVGTSLPELVTSIVADRKGEVGVAVGNVVGSNIFNILFILGISSTIHPITVNAASVFDMMILTGISCLVLAFSLTGKKINRLEGTAMILIYIIDMVFVALR